MNYNRITLLASSLRGASIEGHTITVKTEFVEYDNKYRFFIKAGTATIIRSYSNHYKYNLDVDHEVKTIMRGLQEKLDNPDKRLQYLDT